jgi:NodT family efflux transporter outer membrane factor (OMF) lipoprotein
MSGRWTLLLLAGTLAGCPVGPDYQKPKLPVPQKWAEGENVRAAAPPAAWWKCFGDPVLNKLVGEAIGSNLDFRQTEQRILDARAQRTIAVAQGLPSIDGRATLSKRRNNFIGSGAGSGIGTGSLPTGASGVGGTIFNTFQAGFDAQWEIDLFGGIRRNIESAEASMEAETENRRDVLVSLLAEVARNYIAVRENQRQIAITRDNVAAQEDTLGLTRAREQAGLASHLEVAQQEAQVQATRSQLPVYETAMKQAVHTLGVLLGRPPGALLSLLNDEGRVPAASVAVVADLPSELLRRRPDIRRAERQLHAATAQIGVATADLYPKVNLSGFLGMQNMKISDFTPVGKSWNMTAGLGLPVFNWGRIRANIAAREAQQEQSFLAYQSTVLNAFKEVEDALVAYAQQQQRRQSLERSVDASKLAVALADERYERGLTDFLNVLEAQRVLYQAQSNLVGSEAQVSTNLVALYKALGGGWEAVKE